jgi:hypothetical protein
MPESTKARIINDLIEESVYGPRGSETPPCANAREVSKLIASLQARIETLEAAQQPSQDKLDRLIALDYDDGDPIVMPSSLNDSLGRRVARIIANFASTGLPGDDAITTARAAILEVAAALIDWWDSHEDARTAWEAAKWLEQEANQ